MNAKNLIKRMLRQGTYGLCAFVLCAGAWAQSRNFDIPAGEMKAALDAYAAQSGVQIVYRIEDLRGLVTPGLKRAMAPEEALQALLLGSSLSVQRDSSGAVVIFSPSGRPRSEEGTNQLKAVVVTANRRREPAQEVPMQVGVLSPESLSRSGARSLKDYISREPGVDLNSWGGAGIGSISIRGITTGNDTSATVGVYVDDMAMGSSVPFLNGAIRALDLGLLDLRQIELLRGPQGTLYGASAMGGVLKYVTNDPDTYELSGKVQLGASATRHGGPGSTMAGVINVPLSKDVAGLRVSVFKDRTGGLIDTVGGVQARDIDSGHTSGQRASLLLTPNNKLRVRLTATAQDIQRDGVDYVDHVAGTGQLKEGDLQRRLQVREPYESKVGILSAEIEADLGWARLNSVTSSQQVRSSVKNDFSSAYVPLLAMFGINVQSAAADVRVDGRKKTQELRLTSPGGKQFDWLLGYYYNDEKGTNLQGVPTTVAGGASGPNLATVSLASHYLEQAVFGNATWKFSERLSVTGGLRVAVNRQRTSVDTDGPLVGGKQSLADDSKDTTTTYLLTGRYVLAPGQSVYLRSASAYRPGGPNPVLRDPTTGLPVAPNTYAPDTLVSNEAGYRADLLDKTLSVSAALFDIRWKNIQQYTPVNGVNVIVSAGRAHLQGLELSSVWRPTRDWTWTLGGALTDARLSADAVGLDALSGSRLPNSARRSASLDIQHDLSLWGQTAYLGSTLRHVGERNSGFIASSKVPSHRLPAYSLLDLRAGLSLAKVSLELYLRNLLDERAQLSASTSVSALGGPVWVSNAQPRTFGATLTVPF